MPRISDVLIHENLFTKMHTGTIYFTVASHLLLMGGPMVMSIGIKSPFER